MDGKIGATVEHCPLDLAGEDPLSAEGAEGVDLVAVARGGDVDDFDRRVGGDGGEERGDVAGLPEGERAGAGGDAQGAGFSHDGETGSPGSGRFENEAEEFPSASGETGIFWCSGRSTPHETMYCSA